MGLWVPIVNFINILRAQFGTNKFLTQNTAFVTFGSKILYKKRACKTLMKLTLGEFSIRGLLPERIYRELRGPPVLLKKDGRVDTA